MIAGFADASFYIALLNSRDSLHVAAKRLSDSSTGELVTTEYVLLEVGNYLSKAASREKFSMLVGILRNDPLVEIVCSTQEFWNRGFDLFCRRADKEWSLTDCISFVVMHERGLTDALTADHHFVQAGFNVSLT